MCLSHSYNGNSLTGIQEDNFAPLTFQQGFIGKEIHWIWTKLYTELYENNNMYLVLDFLQFDTDLSILHLKILMDILI